MRYFLRSNSLIVRGKFRICSSGPHGGIRNCTTLINHQVQNDFSHDPDKELELLSYSLGLSYTDTAGLLTAVDMNTLCILSWDTMMVFVTAGITHPDPVQSSVPASEDVPNPAPGTINIIVLTRDFHDQALVDAVITTTEAKVLALRDAGYDFAGTVTDAVIIASEGQGTIRYAGSATETGQRIHETVYTGVTKALLRQSDTKKKKPSFFIRSGMADLTGYYGRKSIALLSVSLSGAAM
jgi:adenosylcobinamide hydrolase